MSVCLPDPPAVPADYLPAILCAMLSLCYFRLKSFSPYFLLLCVCACMSTRTCTGCQSISHCVFDITLEWFLPSNFHGQISFSRHHQQAITQSSFRVPLEWTTLSATNNSLLYPHTGCKAGSEHLLLNFLFLSNHYQFWHWSCLVHPFNLRINTGMIAWMQEP